MNYDEVKPRFDHQEKIYGFDKQSFIQKIKNFADYIQYKNWAVIVLTGIISAVFSLIVTITADVILKCKELIFLQTFFKIEKTKKHTMIHSDKKQYEL